MTKTRTAQHSELLDEQGPGWGRSSFSLVYAVTEDGPGLSSWRVHLPGKEVPDWFPWCSDSSGPSWSLRLILLLPLVSRSE